MTNGIIQYFLCVLCIEELSARVAAQGKINEVRNRLITLRWEEFRLLYTEISPDQELNLLKTKNLISTTETELENLVAVSAKELGPSLTVIASTQPQPSEEQLIDEAKGVAEKEEEDEFELLVPSYLFEEQDDSLDLELIPSYFFDEEEDFPDGVNVKQVMHNEVNCGKLMNLQVISNNNLNQLNFEGFHNYSRILFDRGREIGIVRGFSDVGNYKFYSISNKLGSLVPSVCSFLVDKFDRKSIYGNVLKHGSQLGWLFEDSMVFLWVKNENRHVAGYMFDKMPESVVWWINSGRDDFLWQYRIGKLSYNLIVDECLYLIFGSARGVFDRGKAFKLLARYSYFNGDYELCLDHSTVIVLYGSVLLNLVNKKCACELIPMLGYPHVFQIMKSLVLMCINGADISGDRKLFLQMYDENNIWILRLILVHEIEKVHRFFGAMADCVLRDLTGVIYLYMYFASKCSLFDPGDEFEIIKGISYFATVYSFLVDTIHSSLFILQMGFILLANYKENLVHALLRKHGSESELLIHNLIARMFVMAGTNGFFVQLHFSSTCSIFDPAKMIGWSFLMDTCPGKSVYELVTKVPYDDWLLVPKALHEHRDISQIYLQKIRYLFRFFHLFRLVYPCLSCEERRDDSVFMSSNKNQAQVRQESLQEVAPMLVHFSLSLSRKGSYLYSLYILSEVYGRLIFQIKAHMAVKPYHWSFVNIWHSRLLGMSKYEFARYSHPFYILMWELVCHATKDYGWTILFTSNLRSQVLLMVIQNSVVVMLVVYLRWKFKLPTSESYDSLAIQEQEKKVQCDSVKFVLQSLSYTQHDSKSCMWMWILTSAVCFFNYLCYPYSVFDRGKQLDNSDLRYDKGSLVSELDLRLGYSSEFQSRFPIVFLLVNYGGSGDGIRMFLEVSYTFIGSASIFALQCTEVKLFRKAHKFFGQLPGTEGANMFFWHLQFKLLELKWFFMPATNLSYQLISVLLSSGHYVEFQDSPFVVFLQGGFTTTDHAQLYGLLICLPGQLQDYLWVIVKYWVPCELLVATEAIEQLHHSIVSTGKTVVSKGVGAHAYPTGCQEDITHLYLTVLSSCNCPLFAFKGGTATTYAHYSELIIGPDIEVCQGMLWVLIVSISFSWPVSEESQVSQHQYRFFAFILASRTANNLSQWRISCPVKPHCESTHDP